MSADFTGAFPFRVVPARMVGEGLTPTQGVAGASAPSKKCNCRNSKCLKLYCECFASGLFCPPNVCNCFGCNNNAEHASSRRDAIMATLDRNPNAFRPKIQANGSGWTEDTKHKRGCNCKRSGCLKKYCECFQASIYCSTTCKCKNCKNYEGCPERDAITEAILEEALKAEAKGNAASPMKSRRNSPVKRPRDAGGVGGISDPTTGSNSAPDDATGPISGPSGRGVKAARVENVEPKVSKLNEILSPSLIEIFCRRLLETAKGVKARKKAEQHARIAAASSNNNVSSGTSQSSTQAGPVGVQSNANNAALRTPEKPSPSSRLSTAAGLSSSGTSSSESSSNDANALLLCPEVVDDEYDPNLVTGASTVQQRLSLDSLGGYENSAVFRAAAAELTKLGGEHEVFAAIEAALLSEVHALLNQVVLLSEESVNNAERTSSNSHRGPSTTPPPVASGSPGGASK